MRLGTSAIILAASMNLAACQSINGVPIQPAQGGDSFCDRNAALCIGGGILLAGGIILAASHSGGGGGGMGGGGY